MKRKSDTKTTGIWGKGGNMRSFRYQGGLFYFIAFVLIFLIIFQPVAFASRSSAGGGEIAEFDAGRVAGNIGIGLGTMVVGSALNSAISAAQPVSASTTTLGSSLSNLPTTTTNLFTNTAGQVDKLTPLQAIGNSLATSFSLEGIATNFNTFVAATQVNRAVGMAGSYYGWKPSSTLLVSSVATAGTAGFLNPSAALGSSANTMVVNSFSTMAKGAMVGSIGGLVGGATMVAIDRGRINKGEGPSVGGQIAGMAGSMFGTSLGRTLVDPNTTNTIWEQYTPKKDDTTGKYYQNVNDPNKTITVEELNQKTGVPAIETALEKKGVLPDFKKGSVELVDANKAGLEGRSLTFEDAVKLGQSDKIQYLGNKNRFVISGKNSVQFDLTDEQSKFLANTKIAPDKTVWLPTEGKVDSSLVMQRILTNPVVNTANQWPLIATGGLAIAATNSMGDSQWRPLVNEVIYAVGAPVLDSFATAYELKPSLFSNIDQKLGYVPEAKIERQEMINRAIERRIAQVVGDTKIPAGTTSVPAELTSKFDLETPLEPSKDTTPLVEITGQLKESASTKGKTENKQLSEYDTKTILFGGLTNTLSQRAIIESQKNLSDSKTPGVYDQMPLYEEIGGSKSDLVTYRIHDAFKVDIPAALVSGGIQAGLDKSMGDTTSGKAVLASLGGVVASGVARGIVLHNNATSLYNKQIESAEKEQFMPEVATSRLLTDTTDIVLARIEGALPLPDTKTYKIENGSLVQASISEGGRYKAENNEISLEKDTFFIQNGKTIFAGAPEYNQIVGNAKEVWEVNKDSNKLVSKIEYEDGVRPYEIAKVPGLSATIKGNIGQGLYEFGTKTLNMGMPNTYKGQLSEYGWYKYTQNLGSLSSIAATKGYAAAINSNAVRVGNNITSGNALTVADSLVGLGMAKVVPVVGYKGMPYSEGVLIDKGWSAATMTFYPRWPYSDVNPVQNNPFWSSFNDKLGVREIRTSEDIKGTQQQQNILEKAIQK